MLRVFLDSGVLIGAFKGEPEIREGAFAILSNPNLEFWYSPLLKLEVTLQPTHHKQTVELAFYEEYFRNANCYGDLNRVFEIGNKESLRHGISVVDALHVAAANLSRCVALFTTEKPTKPIFRTKLVTVVGVSGAKATHQRVYKLLEA